jgi:inhibitor of KinA sporulation pathway (predicted exonuclease)
MIFYVKDVRMQYIVMDLEWNNTYSRKKKGFFNEIIEIGAVRLDEQFNTVDTFSQVIKSQVGKKLRSSVKKLTNITNEDVRSGELFTKTFSEFRKWLGKEENTFFTWGDSDIRVLTDNFKYLNGINHIPFIDNYCDLQKCYQKISGTSPSSQTGLNAAAQELKISTDDYSLHRAPDDSFVTAQILAKIYNKAVFDLYTSKCDEEFYNKLFFKAKVISNIDNPIVDKTLFKHSCEKCGKKCKIKEDWKFHNQYFRALYYCDNCDILYKVGVKFKKYYDRIDIRKISSVYNPEEDRKENKKPEET